MKRKILFILTAVALSWSAQAQQSYETKLTTGGSVANFKSDKIMIQAGQKNLNVVQLSDGKMLLDKAYTDAGLNMAKVIDADISPAYDMLVVCADDKAGCINLNTGKKEWEVPANIETDRSGKGIYAFGKNVFVSEKKEKGNYMLTCLDLSTGKKLWSLENEKNGIRNDFMSDLSNSGFLGLFASLGKEKFSFRLLNLQTGNIDLSVDLDGFPAFSIPDYVHGKYCIHTIENEDNAFVYCIDLKAKKLAWKSKSANKSPQLPYTSVVRYYATMQVFDAKLLLKTNGLEAYDLESGKVLYNVPYLPYYKWGVGQYTDGIAEPVVTDNGILIIDRTRDGLTLQLLDKNTGKPVWVSEKLKGDKVVPHIILSENKVVVQNGGLSYFEVINNTGIGKLLDPFVVTAFDLKTGKTAWNYESKKDFYYIAPSGKHIMVAGTKEFQVLDINTGSVASAAKNSFAEDFFMTTFGLSSTHKLQKNVDFDFTNRCVYQVGKTFIKSSF